MSDKVVKLFIDEELWQRVKVVAARARVTAKELYTTAIEREVDALEKELDNGIVKE